MATTIRNPLEWGWDQVRHAAHALETLEESATRPHDDVAASPPMVRRIAVSDFRDIFRKAFEDFGAIGPTCSSCIIYPIIGVVMARVAFGYDMLPLLFPMASRLALIGPFAGL